MALAGGFALWVDSEGMLNHTYSFLGVESFKQVSTEKIPTGEVLRYAVERRSMTGGGGRFQARHDD